MFEMAAWSLDRSAKGAQAIDLPLNVGRERARHEGRDLRLTGFVAEGSVRSGESLVATCAYRVSLHEELRLGGA